MAKQLFLILALLATPAAEFRSLIQATGEVRLQWDPNAASENVVLYRVYRSQVSGSGYQAIGSTDQVTFDDPTAQIHVTYFYVVTAINVDGVESDYSNELEVLISTKPSPPSGLRVTGVGGGVIALSYAPSRGADLYQVWAAISPPLSKFGKPGSNQRRFFESRFGWKLIGVTQGLELEFQRKRYRVAKVVAINSTGYSESRPIALR